jgi:hypothetical protein
MGLLRFLSNETVPVFPDSSTLGHESLHFFFDGCWQIASIMWFRADPGFMQMPV